jgi:hypothetical protein
MKDKVKCSVCEKELFKECMFFNIQGYQDYSMFGDLRKSFGPYAGKDYNICYECWLRGIGVKIKEGDCSPLP